jgi:hypothetical protein
MIGKGKELESPEGRGGGKGEPGVPPILYNIEFKFVVTGVNTYCIISTIFYM